MIARPSRSDLDTFARRLRIAIERGGMTQAEAAEAAGISLAQLRKYLAALASPSLFPVSRLAASLRIDLEWLVAGTETAFERRRREAAIAAARAAIAPLAHLGDDEPLSNVPIGHLRALIAELDAREAWR